MKSTKRRWREDGPDSLTGSQRLNAAGYPTGPGGTVTWSVYGYFARAWIKGKSWELRFKKKAKAISAVEEWLEFNLKPMKKEMKIVTCTCGHALHTGKKCRDESYNGYSCRCKM